MVVVAIAAAWLGAIAGLIGVRVLEPSNAEVREAAGRLVPPTATVTGRESGERGFCPFRRCPYLAYVDTIGGGESHDARIASYLAQAEREAWRLVKTERYPGGVVLRYERGRLRASIHVRFSSSGAIHVERTEDGATRRGVTTGAMVGCVTGASAYGAWALRGRRRARDQRPTNASVRLDWVGGLANCAMGRDPQASPSVRSHEPRESDDVPQA